MTQIMGASPLRGDRVLGPSAPEPLRVSAFGHARIARRSGPYGIDCTCDVWAPCESCARAEQIEEAQMASMFNRAGGGNA